MQRVKGVASAAICLVAILAAVYGVLWLMQWAAETAEALTPGAGDIWMQRMIWGLLAAYALLIALPFMPGVEIGISLMMMRGADIALSVYLATILGLGLAFLVGRLVPLEHLARLCERLRLARLAQLLHDPAAMTPERRLAHLRRSLPGWLAAVVVEYRYLTLAILLNLPGNIILGGGGGIMLLAGMSRLFAPHVTLVAVAAGVLPVPLMVWLFEVTPLDLFK